MQRVTSDISDGAADPGSAVRARHIELYSGVLLRCFRPGLPVLLLLVGLGVIIELWTLVELCGSAV